MPRYEGNTPSESLLPFLKPISVSCEKAARIFNIGKANISSILKSKINMFMEHLLKKKLKGCIQRLTLGSTGQHCKWLTAFSLNPPISYSGNSLSALADNCDLWVSNFFLIKKILGGFW